MTRAKKITKRQVDVLNTLDMLTYQNKRPPSLHELMQAVDAKSTSAVGYQLRAGVRIGRAVELRTAAGKKYVPAWWWKMVSENVEKYYENNQNASNRN